jgi:hypothetical protein
MLRPLSTGEANPDSDAQIDGTQSVPAAGRLAQACAREHHLGSYPPGCSGSNLRYFMGTPVATIC